jgi:hypothetical protein
MTPLLALAGTLTPWLVLSCPPLLAGAATGLAARMIGGSWPAVLAVAGLAAATLAAGPTLLAAVGL